MIVIFTNDLKDNTNKYYKGGQYKVSKKKALLYKQFIDIKEMKKQSLPVKELL